MSYDTEPEQTLVDLEIPVPYRDSSATRDAERSTDELSLDDISSLIVSVETSEPRSYSTETPNSERVPGMVGDESAVIDSIHEDAYTAPLPSQPPSFHVPRADDTADLDDGFLHPEPMAEVVTEPTELSNRASTEVNDAVLTEMSARAKTETDTDRRALPLGNHAASRHSLPVSQRSRLEIVGGRYKIIERVGVGGMGKVFKVTHNRLGKTFALKIISGAMAGENKARELFYREARLASSLSHPNVTSVVDFGEDDQVGAFMVMEFLNGEALSDRLQREQRLNVRLAGEIIRQVGEALDYIHNKGIVHCDIKSENILLTEVREASKRNKLQVKLLDFGLARSTTGTYNTASVAGTPHYVAPERLRGANASPSNDIYALGILFYELLTGQVPWDGTVNDILRGHLDLEPMAPSRLIEGGLDSAVEKLVLRTLAKKPSERHSNISAFLYELQTVMDMLGYGRRKRGRKRLVSGDKADQTYSQRDKITRSLFDAARIPMALLNRQGIILAANPAFARFIMGIAVDVEGMDVHETTLMGVWQSLDKDLARACAGKSVRRTIKVDTESARPRRLVMWLDPGLDADQAIFGAHPLTGTG